MLWRICFCLYPSLICLYPIWRLYLVNQDRMSLAGLVVSAAALLLVSLLCQGVARIAFGAGSSASLITSFLWLEFWSFSPLTRYLYRSKYLAELAAAEDLVLILFLILSIAVASLLWRFRGGLLAPLQQFMTLSVVCLYAFLLLAPPGLSGQNASDGEISFPALSPVILKKTSESLPDIYLIVLDAYGRSDELRRVLGYDNSSFIQGLQSNGFTVADRSTSNYAQTLLSLSSILNLDYLDEVLRNVPRKSKGRAPLRALLRTNRVVSALQELGYKFVYFGSGYAGTEMPQADIRGGLWYDPGEFGNLVVSQSPIPALARHFPSSRLRYWQYGLHRKRLATVFQNLSELAQVAKPKFVLAHVLAPHPPFVFSAAGQDVNADRIFGFHDGNQFRGSREDYRLGYMGQAQWVEAQVLQAVRNIAEHSPDAIIIVQGDHGSGLRLNWRDGAKSDLRERMSILNAYRLPDSMRAQLYATITPVNSFRIILNSISNLNLPLLPDKSYFSLIDRPYAFADVTSQVTKHPS
ncbi:MAG: LTA synthase family protein [Oligoflexia bacterium]|nr:LTA synthase family protein [Oligoflexia bacterium]